MQQIALAIIAIAAIVIAVLSVLLFRRAGRLIDEAAETLRIVNRFAPKIERLLDEAEKEVAVVRTITARLARVSEQAEVLAVETVGALATVLDSVKRWSRPMALLKTVIVGVAAGAGALRRRRGRIQ